MSEWIGVEERLPEHKEDVLVFYSGIDRPVDGSPPRVDRATYLSHSPFLFEELYGPVTHWMPLPEPPEVKV